MSKENCGYMPNIIPRTMGLLDDRNDTRECVAYLSLETKWPQTIIKKLDLFACSFKLFVVVVVLCVCAKTKRERRVNGDKKQSIQTECNRIDNDGASFSCAFLCVSFAFSLGHRLLDSIFQHIFSRSPTKGTKLLFWENFAFYCVAFAKCSANSPVKKIRCTALLLRKFRE